jgi:glycosyltransferase involved in cell wall biosynthesis
MTKRGPAPVVLLVVPPGTVDAGPLAAAVTAAHPAWRVAPVWAGDPHLRPALTGPAQAWFDTEDDGTELRQRQLASRAPLDSLWLRSITAARSAFEAGAGTVVVLVVGSVAVLGPLDALLAPMLTAGGDEAPAVDPPVAVLVPRVHGALSADGLGPGEDDLVATGTWSPDVIALSDRSGALLDWLEHRITEGPVEGSLGRVLDRAAAAFEVVACTDPAIGVGAWRWEVARPALVDLPGFDAAQPWTLDPGNAARARVDVAGDPARVAVLRSAAPQLGGEIAPITLPGGLVVDDVIRELVADDPRCPPAWSSPAAFRAWLEPRYWTALHGSRRDLAAAFPSPRGGDAERFRTWCRRAFVDDHVGVALGVPPEPDDRWSTAPSLASEGVNLVGYLTRESSLGDVARRVGRALDDAGVAVAPLAVERTASPRLDGSERVAGVITHRRSIAVVNADQFPALAMDHPELFAAGTHLVGYWFWELEHVPAPMRHAASLVDEIWVGSTFVADAFRSAVDTPVRHVPIPVAAPVASDRDRASFPVLAPLGDRFVFAVVFDHFSVTERKNPVGVIEAFRRAFQPDEGPVLVVKSMNAAKRWPQHQHVVASAAGRPDIVLWDEHLDRADHMAFIAAADALVALHRSEGLGLHLAEAMWLGTPVIATRYSGNLDFMDDDCSILIDASLVPVERGEGVYPPEARWADPDLDQAAAAMRSLASDPTRCAALASAGRARMERQPTLADTGCSIAGLLGIEMAS